jgi:hypothetical protein
MIGPSIGIIRTHPAGVPVSPKQEAFILAYVETGNASEASRSSGPPVSQRVAGRKPTIDLPAAPNLGKLPLDDLAKLLAPKK